MAGNVRIYELAKELGIDSAKCIELCEEAQHRHWHDGFFPRCPPNRPTG